MVTALLLTSDTRLATEVGSWMRFMSDKVHTATFKNFEELKKEIEGEEEEEEAQAQAQGQPAPAANGANPANPAAKKKDPLKKEEIRVVIVDIDVTGAKPIQWLTDLHKLLKDKLPPMPVAVKVLMMCHDGGAFRPETFQIDMVDDLVVKPLDRQLFLQKVEILAADSPKVSPSFLFRQKTDMTIEVGKDIVIDEFSEFAISMRNPGPLSEGLYATIHCDVFGEKGNKRVIGRVYESAKHPVREGEFVVRFALFGVNQEQISSVRKYVRQFQTQVRTKAMGAPRPKAPAAASGALFQKMRRIAVIDMDTEILNEVKNAVETGFKSVNVRAIPSYTRLIADLKKFIPESAKVDPKAGAKPPVDPKAQAPKPADPKGPKPPPPLEKAFAFAAGPKVTLILRGGTGDLMRFEQSMGRTDTILGRPVAEFQQKPGDLVAAIDKEDKDSFEEFLGCCEAGISSRCAFRVADHTGKQFYISASGTLEKSGASDGIALIRVNLEEVDATKFKEISTPPQSGGAAASNPNFYKFEAIFIDASFIRPDPVTWYERFVETLRAAGVVGADEQPPKIFVMADPRSRIKIDEYRIKGITDFTYKPLDRRMIVQKMAAMMPYLQLSRDPEHPAFVPCEISAKLGKEVKMSELSEFGLAINQPSPFKERIFMRFFSKLFSDEGSWVAGRCLHCEKTEGEAYRCQFMFFGQSDELLQRIRRFIREDYVSKKDGDAKRA